MAPKGEAARKQAKVTDKEAGKPSLRLPASKRKRKRTAPTADELDGCKKLPEGVIDCPYSKAIACTILLSIRCRMFLSTCCSI